MNVSEPEPHRIFCWNPQTSHNRLRFGFSLLYKTVFHLNCLKAKLSYEGRVAVEVAK
jgi:hypothetical protein